MKWKPRFLAAGIAFTMHWLVIFVGFLLPFPQAKAYLHLTHTPLDHLLQWDAQWYVTIAKYGYNIPLSAQYAFIARGNTVPFPHLQAAAFFPLVPIIIHVFGIVWAFIIDNLVFFLSLVFIFALFQDKLSPRTSLLAVVLFATNFSTVYQSALYTTAYGTLFSVLVLFGMQRGDRRGDIIACIAGFLASFNHELGILLIMLGIHYLRQKRLRMMVAYGTSVLAGWGIVSFYLWLRFGSPLAMFKAQNTWGRAWVFPGYNLIASVAQNKITPDTIFVPILVIFIVLHLWHSVRVNRNIRRTMQISIVESPEVAFWMTSILLLGMCAFTPSYPLTAVTRFLDTAWPMFGFVWFKNDLRRSRWMFGVLIISILFSAFGSGMYTHGIMFE